MNKIGLLTFSVLLSGFFTKAQDRPDIIAQYQNIEDMDLYIIGNTGNSIANPTDLEFHPDLSKNELWVVNKGTESSGGHTVIFSETGEDTQTSLTKADEYKEIYMSLVTGIAFGSNENFATCSGGWDNWDDGGDDPYAGATLWDSDLSVYGEPGMGDGSHIDDLHQSPYSQGIAWETENVFWVFDGYNGDIVRYNFVDDHGPGGFGSSDGIVHRYQGLSLQMDTNDIVVSHLDMDHETNWLYCVDHGNNRVIRIDITTGTPDGAPFFGPFESIAEYKRIVDFDWEVVVSDTTIAEPSGIAIVGNKMLLADHATGDIIVYLMDGGAPFEEWFRIETEDEGIQGLEIGPDGRIFYANEFNNKIRRIDGSTLDLPEIKETVDLKIYPNPAKKQVTVTSDLTFKTKDVRVYSQAGQRLALNARQKDNRTIEILVDDLEKGIYTIRIVTSGGNAIQRLVIE